MSIDSPEGNDENSRGGKHGSSHVAKHSKIEQSLYTPSQAGKLAHLDWKKDSTRQARVKHVGKTGGLIIGSHIIDPLSGKRTS